MSDLAPGQDAPKHEASCFNCGSQAHFAFACPEDTRARPAGLDTMIQRNRVANSANKSTSRSATNRSSGPIITRYGPPAPIPPPPVAPWFPNQHPMPMAGSTYSYPQSMRQTYNYGQAQYAQAPRHTGPMPPSYPPYGAPGSSYGTPGAMAGIAPSYGQPPHPMGYHSASFPPGGYHAGAAYAQPSHANSNPPYPSPQYHGNPNPYSAPYPHGSRSAAQPQVSLQPIIAPALSVNPAFGLGRPSDKAPSGTQRPGHSDSNPTASSRLGDHESAVIRSRAASVSSAAPGASGKLTEGDVRGESEMDFEWELRTAFIQNEGRQSDAVGHALPSVWTDDPTIPPAYNATCLKSAYFNADDEATFALPIRQSKHWDKLQQDPLFKFRRGMVSVTFGDDANEYFTYHISTRLASEIRDSRRTRPNPADARLVDRPALITRQSYPGDATRTGDSASCGRIKGKRTWDESCDRDYRPIKRHESYHAPSNARTSPRERRARGESNASRHRRHVRERTPPPYERGSRHREGEQRARESPRQRSRERPHSGTARDSRERSPARIQHDALSPSRKPSIKAGRARRDSTKSNASSQMSDLEYELLGIDRPEPIVKSGSPAKPTPKRRPIRVNDAFSRRW